jgi:hypothetical protein
MIILKITTLKDWWMDALIGTVKRCQTQSLFFPDYVGAKTSKEVCAKVV